VELMHLAAVSSKRHAARVIINADGASDWVTQIAWPGLDFCPSRQACGIAAP